MALKEFDLSGKVALVTGAGQGLGEQMALALAEAGADMALAGRNMEKLDGVAKRIRKMGRRAVTIRADVRRESEVLRIVKKAFDVLKRIDILVNNAGIMHRVSTAESSLQSWNETIATNLTGPFMCMKACFPIMAGQGGGTIINLSSVAGLVGRPNAAAYCASKAGVANLTRALAIEWAPYGIRVNAIAPGQFATEMGAPLLNDKKALRAYLKNIPLRRVGNPREIGPLAVLLASDASTFITGAILPIDGGTTAY